METTQQQHLFGETDYQVVQAGSGKRFANYIIDLITFYVVIFLLSEAFVRLSPETAYNFYSTPGFDIIDRLLTLVLYGIYMFIIEAAFKGKSIGKFITGTRAVNMDGSNISVTTALLRGLSRSVPFNAFSALGTPCYPWHDRWTKTYVIDEKQSHRPEEN